MHPFNAWLHSPAVIGLLHDLLALGLGLGSVWCFYRMFREWRGHDRRPS